MEDNSLGRLYLPGPLLMLSLVFTGCQAEPRTDDLGEIIHKLPEVPGADQPYFLPELGPPPPDGALPAQPL